MSHFLKFRQYRQNTQQATRSTDKDIVPDCRKDEMIIMSDEYLDKAIEIAAQIFGVSSESLNENSTWEKDLQVDVKNSLQNRDYCDYIARLNNEFGIDIPNMKFGRTRNLGEVAAMIESLTGD